MFLTHENYFSPEMMLRYMSNSQFHSFERCEAAAMDELRNGQKDKDCFTEGHYFEACLQGAEAEALFLMQNPSMVCSRDTTRDGVKISSKGDLKSNFSKIGGAVEAFKRQPMFMDAIGQCRSQVIVTGTIAGISFKGCVDFLNDRTLAGYDTKCMANFKKVWSDTDGMYVNWYFAYGYHYQAAIYLELIRQEFGRAGDQHILGVTKEEIPDVTAITFTDDILNNALEIVTEFAPRYAAIKRGEIEPEACGHCEYCRTHKVLGEFQVVGEYE